MPQSLAAVYCHIVFSTRDREPVIDEAIRERLYGFMGGILRERRCVLTAIGGVADHVHLLVSLSREICLADCVRDVKALSSGWVHAAFPDHSAFWWQAGYGVFSVSPSGLDPVRRYIANQERHHAATSFQDEYRGLLHRAGVEFDERYVWD